MFQQEFLCQIAFFKLLGKIAKLPIAKEGKLMYNAKQNRVFQA
jgi:hypothetical protein